jgi:single-strand DNA-binding protein
MNSVHLIGRLTRDPELRYTTSQMAVATFSMAIDRPTRADREKETDFPRVTVFGKQAENC